MAFWHVYLWYVKSTCYIKTETQKIFIVKNILNKKKPSETTVSSMNELQGHMQYYTVGWQVKTMTGSIKMGTSAMVYIVWEIKVQRIKC